jgi:transposase
MFPAQPKIRHLSRRNAPRHAPCPHCGALGNRKETCSRTVRSIAYGAILLVHVTTAEYRATCDCCTTFRTQVDGIEPKAKYTNSVREAVLDRLLEDRLNVDRLLVALRRDFFLELSTGFVYDCLRWKVEQLDGAAYRQWALQEFSGTLCIDEIHLGVWTLLLATDPLHDFPVAFALVSKNDQDHLGRFLRQLRAHGFHPRVVVTDGSNLYPTLLATVWPQAEHQLCVFHIMQDLTKEVLDAVKRLRRQQSRRGRAGRKRRQGRRRSGSPRLTAKDKAHYVFKHRYLIVKRSEKLSIWEKRALQTMLEYLPALRVLHHFMERVYRLLEASQTEEQAWQRYAEWQAKATFRAVPELAAILEGMPVAKFAKVVAFLRSPLGQRVRTNNHVERLNRQVRSDEKARYRWRTGRGIVRWVVLLLERCRQSRQAAGAPRLFAPGPGAEPAHGPAVETGEPPQADHGRITGLAAAG